MPRTLPKASPRAAAPEPAKLDSTTLGRPVHLLPLFCARLRDDLSDFFEMNVNRRYGADFRVTSVDMQPNPEERPAKRRLSFDAPEGRLACHVDRTFALALLAYRYKLGSQGKKPDCTKEITSTEERVTQLFIQQLAPLLLKRAQSGTEIIEAPPTAPSKAIGLFMASPGSWRISVKVLVTADCEGEIDVILDAALVSSLLHSLMPRREPPKGRLDPQPLSSRLVVEVTARLLQRRVTIGELLDLKPGVVIPIRLGATDILVGESRLMTATVAQHKGKLCLTQFQDVE